MNHDSDPRKDALTDEERDLARIARALPGAVPSAETDRRILDAARAAVGGSSPRRKFAWRWGFGASAAAVLVVALVWPVLLPEREPPTDFPLSPAPAPSASAPAPAPSAPAALRRDRAAPALEEPATEARMADRAAESDTLEPEAANELATRQALAAPAPLPPVEDDAALEPADWLNRIRARLAADDEAGARRSLAAFVLRHPEHPLPDDLKRLAE